MVDKHIPQSVYEHNPKGEECTLTQDKMENTHEDELNQKLAAIPANYY
jgi:hypothetical protein